MREKKKKGMAGLCTATKKHCRFSSSFAVRVEAQQACRSLIAQTCAMRVDYASHRVAEECRLGRGAGTPRLASDLAGPSGIWQLATRAHITPSNQPSRISQGLVTRIGTPGYRILSEIASARRSLNLLNAILRDSLQVACVQANALELKCL
ncbi:hypothetical protein BJY04DRAFT_63201 [Aspergillus karnatakaensis]|uniref:uncharacterized protein n=1 Tax=Aspergillus karnatakaensis TaxID=1810916 RepID=UPI003CCC90C5